MSEAVLDHAIEQIADGMSVDWSAFDKVTPSRGREWAQSLRILNDIVNLHRNAAADYEQTTLANATEPTVSSAVPDTWGKYRLTTRVGEGSYGSVYRAWDSELERDVAIKILHRRVGDTRLKERLLQEGRALAKIRHNNVVNVLGVEAHGDRVGLCMEFVHGKTLADIVRGQGKMSAAEAVSIGEDLCRALAAVHRAGYLHRDVKAKNVMRDDTGRIVLMDFGTGRTADAHGKGDRAGTPLYMAPEVIEDGQASPRSDVYSLGVLLYNLVTGDYPVRANSVDELREAHANREHRWLSEVRPNLPVAFMQAVEKAIALDPEERYADASELLAALSSLKIGAARTWLWRAGKPVVVLAVGLVGMTLLGAITSTHFNMSLGRSDYATETAWDYLVWGRRTSLPPFLILMVLLLGTMVVVWVRRALIALSSTLRRLDASVWARGAAIAHRLRLDEVPVLASCALVVSVAATWTALSHFYPLIMALINLPVATDDQLRLLSPSSVALHNQYRWIFSLVVIFSVVVWYPVVKLVRRGQSLHPGLATAGVVATCVAVALLHFPYRMLYFNQLFPFEAATWNGSRCYIIGARDSDRLLYCPELPPPRNRTVKSGDESLVPLGVRESPFSRYQGISQGAGSARP
jgi:protein kinase-like protein